MKEYHDRLVNLDEKTKKNIASLDKQKAEIANKIEEGEPLIGC